ncbi:MAG: hypothetical protein U9R32_02345 [Bacteroidota bacterium]|nr:hypothetical protein [Bacteroidota bacterium]
MINLTDWEKETLKNLNDIDAETSSNSIIKQYHHIENIKTLTLLIAANCKQCEETERHCAQITEITNILLESKNAPKAVHRSINKNLKTIIKHLQSKHGYSLPNQFKEAWMILSIVLLGIFGIAALALTMKWIYPIAGIIIGAIGGYIIGSNHDKKSEKENKIIDWK